MQTQANTRTFSRVATKISNADCDDFDEAIEAFETDLCARNVAAGLPPMGRVNRIIPGFPEFEVSREGRVRLAHGVPFITRSRFEPSATLFEESGELILFSGANENLCVVIGGQELPVFELVAAAFLPNPFNKKNIGFINGDRSDFRACNLYRTNDEILATDTEVENKTRFHEEQGRDLYLLGFLSLEVLYCYTPDGEYELYRVTAESDAAEAYMDLWDSHEFTEEDIPVFGDNYEVQYDITEDDHENEEAPVYDEDFIENVDALSVEDAVVAMLALVARVSRLTQ